MASRPFGMGLPVVDQLPMMDGAWVLRSVDRDQLIAKLKRFSGMFGPDCLIVAHVIGFRPDKPIPVPMYFAEVRVYMGLTPEEIERKTKHFWWTYVLTGKRKQTAVYYDED